MSISGSVPRNINPLHDSFLHVFEQFEMFKHIFSFILTQITMGFRISKNQDLPKFQFLAFWNNVSHFQELGARWGFPFSRAWESIVTRIEMKEKISLNILVWSKTCRNELSNGFPWLGNRTTRNGNSYISIAAD